MLKIIATLVAIYATYFISDSVFGELNLYSEILWLDIPMHILGGFLFALLFIFGWRYFRKGYKLLLVYFFVFVFVIGVLWEVHEYYNWVQHAVPWRGALDTVKDLVNDMLGAGLALFITKANR